MSTNDTAKAVTAADPARGDRSLRRTLPAAEVDRFADEIAEISAHVDAATQRLLELLRRFDEGSGWYTHGCLSCAQWLSWRIGLDLPTAREKVRVARALGSLPHIDDALRRGQVSYSKVRALTRVATPENEASLLEMARSSTASQLERICRGYRRACRGILGELTLDEADRRWVHERSTDSGMIRIEALDDGTSLSRITTERLACDAALVTVVEDAQGSPLDVGRRRRTVPTALRRALRLRDRGCRYPGCTNARVDSHHVIPWSRGGETKLSNLCSLCRRHHVYVHELGFRIEPRDHGDFAFFAPAGWEVKPTCPTPELAPDPIASLRAQHQDAGLSIDAATSFPHWDGTPPDYDHIVYVIANKYPAAGVRALVAAIPGAVAHGADRPD